MRPGWAIRLVGWLCLLALLLGQGLPPLGALAAADSSVDSGAICHAGAPSPDSSRPDLPFNDCSHCPLCHMVAHAAFTPPQPVGFAVPPPPPEVLGRLATASPPPLGTANGGPLQPRAPPVVG